MKTKLLPNRSSRLSLAEHSPKVKESAQLVAYGHLLVSVDFSKHSKKTIEYATRLAVLTDASIKLLHVCQIPEHPAAFYHGLHSGNDLIKSLVEMATREASEQLSLASGEIRAQGLKVQPILRVGNPYEEIVRAAKEMKTDLIIIGSYGHRGLGRLLLGSTAERVLQYAPCAVLIVKDESAKSMRRQKAANFVRTEFVR
jgi:universal stress protein A